MSNVVRLDTFRKTKKTTRQGSEVGLVLQGTEFTNGDGDWRKAPYDFEVAILMVDNGAGEQWVAEATHTDHVYGTGLTRDGAIFDLITKLPSHTPD